MTIFFFRFDISSGNFYVCSQGKQQSRIRKIVRWCAKGDRKIYEETINVYWNAACIDCCWIKWMYPAESLF
jgi:hypothetical protein